ncbi:MAG: ATP-grasp domain-containing protein [Actinomycetota bacterium]|nr:ATP-grasp domain-containing protein [Actinomycetota bacterium]MDQ6934487.1 ATP-grasp domain-containing protein [Actinomycetota bacterium]
MSAELKSLLIANRGEIARRIIRSAKRRGLRTVAVYSDADRGAAHVREADEAVRLGPTPAAQSYLNIEEVLRAARETGAQAIHPGYGFLSERSEFARAVADAGLVFVGPPAEVIARMGRKDHARQVATAAGVPVVPEQETFPVLVKAAAGGGGKGMRIVRQPSELAAAIESARREAMSAFGDDTILVEQYVEHGRHIEVQVLADRYGTVLHLFERDCSTQRRHQKVIEEAPATSIDEDVRRLLTGSAVALAREAGYVNAGTVEFLVDPARGTDGVYFLEMNTRLQVEHPVTELVTGLDLVDLQLAVAAGEPLPFAQEEVTCTGHAIEARIYAEDAYAGFLPQAGRATIVRWSALARNDEALESGQVVSSAYDPMLGKVIVHGSDRESARRQLVAALDDTVILGLTTNTGFVRQLVASSAFAANEIDTAWLDRHAEEIGRLDEELAAVFAAAAIAEVGVERSTVDPFGSGDGWRLGGTAAPVHVDLVRDAKVERWQVFPDHIDGPRGSHPARVVSAERHVLRLELDGQVRDAVLNVTPARVEVALRGSTYAFDRVDDADAAGAVTLSDGAVLAQMPGTMLAVNVESGQAVRAGETLGVLEAMKMELALKAPFDGTVDQVGARAGDEVAMGTVLFVVRKT